MRSAMVRSSTSSTGSTNETLAAAPAPPVLTMMDDVDSPVGFEGGMLTTTINVNGSNNDQQLPSTTATSSSSADPNTLYVIANWDALNSRKFLVTTAKIHPLENANAKKFVCYEISLLSSSSSARPFSIWRRYTDLLALYDGLRKEFPLLMQTVVFPRKCFTGNFSYEVVRDRVVLFEQFLDVVLENEDLRTSSHFLRFLQDHELEKACRLLDERRSELALPILENCFGILDKLYTDRCHPVLLVLCRLVAASSHPIPAPDAHKWAEMALRRFDGVCDADLLQLYVPLIKVCVYLYWKTGRDKSHLDAQLEGMRKRGINVKTGPTLQQAIHSLDPRTESA